MAAKPDLGETRQRLRQRRLRLRRVRWATIGCGLAIFLWLAPEDNAVWPPVLLGTLTATLATTAWALRRWGGEALSPRFFVLLMIGLGLLAGMGASVTTAALMLLKNAQHGHVFPDYPLGLVGAILARAPLWALGGALGGLGSALIWKALVNFTVKKSASKEKRLSKV